jgi:hypothetical protein
MMKVLAALDAAPAADELLETEPWGRRARDSKDRTETCRQLQVTVRCGVINSLLEFA